jgi:hypothetical protein
MTKSTPQLDSVSICTHTKPLDTSEVTDTFNQFSEEVERPNLLENQRVDKRPDNPTNSQIIFSEASPEEERQEDSNSIVIDILKENEEGIEIHIHANISGDHIEIFEDVFEDITEIIELEIEHLIIDFDWNTNFSTLEGLPVDWDSELEINGVRINYDERDYAVQSLSEFDDDDHRTGIRCNSEKIEELSRDNVSNFISTEKGEAERFLSDLK